MLFVTALLLTGSLCGLASAQTLYKFRGENGEWIYADRPPDDGRKAETRQLQQRHVAPKVSVSHELDGREVVLTAHNSFHAPMEMTLLFEEIAGVEFPDPDQELRWVLPPNGDLPLLRLGILEAVSAPTVRFKYRYLPGNPAAIHRPEGAYRVPYSAGTSYPVTQAYPDAITHNAIDSVHAIDLAMPIGSDVVAARGGVVFEVAADNFRSGLDPVRDGQSANVVRILHDDGTFALYAHLNWNSIRVRPGDRVATGEYIADSGNTGFSSGPHLHFAIQRNSGMRIDSIPIVFKGPGDAAVAPARGDVLTAYP